MSNDLGSGELGDGGMSLLSIFATWGVPFALSLAAATYSLSRQARRRRGRRVEQRVHRLLHLHAGQDGHRTLILILTLTLTLSLTRTLTRTLTLTLRP